MGCNEPGKVTGRMSQLGQTRKSGDAITTSALPPTADIPDSGCDVRKVPNPEELRVSKSRPRCAQEQTSRPPGVDRCRKSDAARTGRIAGPPFEQNLNGTRSET